MLTPADDGEMEMVATGAGAPTRMPLDATDVRPDALNCSECDPDPVIRRSVNVATPLVFEVPDAEVEQTLTVIKKVMEDAPLPALSLSVPLAVEARAADNWDDAH